MKSLLLLLALTLPLFGQGLIVDPARFGSSEEVIGSPVNLFFQFSGTDGDMATTNHVATARIPALGDVIYIEGRIPEHTRIKAWPFTKRVPFNANGTVISNTTHALLFDMGSEIGGAHTWEGFRWLPSGLDPIEGVTAMWRVMLTNVAADAAANFDFPLVSGQYGVGQWQLSQGTYQLVAHSEPGTAGAINGMTSNVWYNIHVRINNDAQKVEVAALNAITGELLGTASKVSPGGPGGSDYGALVYAMMQDYLWDGADSMQLLIGEWAFGWGANNRFPLEPVEVPDVENVYAVQTGTNEVRLTWNGLGATSKVERDGGAGWVTLTNEMIPVAWTGVGTGSRVFYDSNAVEGTTYQYRVTAQIGDYSSAPVSSGSITITNSHPGWPVVWQEMTNYYSSVAQNSQAMFPTIQQRIKAINSATVQVSRISVFFDSISEQQSTNGEQLVISMFANTNRTGRHYATSKAMVLSTNTGWRSMDFFTPTLLPPGSNFWFGIEGGWPIFQLGNHYDDVTLSYLGGEGFDLWYNNSGTIGGAPYDMMFKVYVLHTPTVPTNLVATQTATNQITLGWSDSNDGLANYKIDRKVGAGSWEVGYTNVARGVTNLVLNSQTDSETYLYRIYGYADGETGSESSSDEFDAITIDNDLFPDPVWVYLLAEGDATEDYTTEAYLRWSTITLSAGDITGFAVKTGGNHFGGFGLKVGVYSAGSLIAQGTITMSAANTLCTTTITGVPIAGGTYVIATMAQLQGQNTIRSKPTTSGIALEGDFDQSYAGAMPSTLPSSDFTVDRGLVIAVQITP